MLFHSHALQTIVNIDFSKKCAYAHFFDVSTKIFLISHQAFLLKRFKKFSQNFQILFKFQIMQINFFAIDFAKKSDKYNKGNLIWKI